MFRVAAAYAVVGFGLAEGAQVFFPALGFPDGAARVVAILVLAGFPIAIGLSWAFDLTGQGVRRTGPRDEVPWERVGPLFARATELPESQRDDFVSREAEDDPMLLAELRSLLAAHARTGLLDEWDEEPPPTVEAGQVLGHYRIEGKIGAGAMGVIYRAVDTRLDRRVALKFLSAELTTHPEAKERFLVEARAAAALDHPNVCTIHEVGEADDGRLYIVMAYYEGETLRERIRRGGLSVVEALDITLQAARGLAAAASRGVIHRDVKPANLFLTGDQIVKILDFGIAKMEATDLTQPGAWIGTASYMSPEQARGEPVDQRTDVWALGVILYELLAGERPFQGRTDYAVVHAILNTSPRPIRELVPELPKGVEGIVGRALSPSIEERYEGAAALAADLQIALETPDALVAEQPRPSLSPEGERRGVTVLAVSVQGYETLLDAYEPDTVDRLFGELRSQIETLVADYGGVLNESSEEMVIALFGVPLTYGDDVLRAVRAAMRLVEIDAPDSAVRLRAAVGSQLASVRDARDGSRRYIVGGRVVGDVTRLARLAPDGGILMDPELAPFVLPFIAFEELEPVTVSDGSSMRPLRIVGDSGFTHRLEALAPAELTRFAGRGAEMEVLTRTLHQAQRGEGRAVAVVGSAGVGKSRLIREFRASTAAEDVRFVRGRCQAHGSLTAYLPFIECLRDVLGLEGESGEDGDGVESAIRELSAELDAYLPVVFHLLSIESERFPLPPYLTGDDLRAVIAEALCVVITRAARPSPLVVLFEDWHWADSGSTEVLEQLAELAAGHAVLIVVTSRPDEEAEATLAAADTRIDLEPLDPGAAVDVVRASLRAEECPDPLVRKVIETTGGNPFFIEEVCRTLLETGTVDVEDGVASVRRPLDEHAIPDTVQAVLRTRLDRLDPEARELLRTASVIGRTFGLDLLRRIAPSPTRVESALQALRAADLVHRTGPVTEAVYRFKHALVLDVAYDSLFDRQRRERHGRVGEAIEELHSDRLEEHADRLAEHFAAAGAWDRAVRYGRMASDRAAALWRIDDAAEVLERVRAWVLRQDLGGEDRRETLASVLLELERHLETIGNRQRQQEVIEELSSLFGTDELHPLRAEVEVRQGELYTLTGRHAEAVAELRRAIRTAEELDDEAMRNRAFRSVAHLHWNRGEYELARPYLEALVEISRKGDDPSELLRDLLNLGRVLRETGELDAAFEIAEEAKTLSRASTHQGDLTYLNNYLGHLYKMMGRSDEALSAFAEATRLTKEAHMPVRHAFNLFGTGTMQLEMGMVEEAFAAYELAVSLVRHNRTDMAAHGLSLIGDGHMSLGDPEAAIPHYRESAELLRGLENPRQLAHAVENLAKALESTGDPEAVDRWTEARTHHEAAGNPRGVLTCLEHEAGLVGAQPGRCEALLHRAIETASQLGDVESEARSWNRLGLQAWRDGRLAEAEEHLRAGDRILRTGDHAAELGVVLNGLGVVLTAAGRLDEAIAALTEAESLHAQADNEERRADSLSALGAAYRELGDLTRAYDVYQQCLDARRAVGDRAGEGWAAYRLAQVSESAGATERAEAFRRQAVSVAREIGDRSLEDNCTGAQNEQ